jgi:hypothetical protein
MSGERTQNSLDKKIEKLREEQRKLEKKKKDLERDFLCELGMLMRENIGSLDAKTLERAKAIYTKHEVVFDAKVDAKSDGKKGDPKSDGKGAAE